ncbi:nucleolar protein 58-like [Selaginella moellendorffii]|uniref:nucleolar protein 58-like n=1 Tax=Selaginella moellendorffii TaxID=88036 RepID=UPI000D1C46D7|nr:nucleolar protein 58-like [Selaginella moellendorffii]|eukprot:XP_024543046.1 nucleolar protein 58-like [Selaginella moellendorffii]
MGHRRKQGEESSSDSSLSTDTSKSFVSSGYSSPDARRRKKRRREKRVSESETDYSSSDDEARKRERKKQRRKRRQKREHHRAHREKSSGEKKRRKERHESRRPKKSRKQHHHETEDDEEHGSNKAATQAKLQVTMEAREQEKNLIYQNAQLAKARLNGELREVQAQQAKMQDMYGTIDWRARKKLRLEKKKLERSVAAGKKLAQIEEEESARMDAFRVALGLPTAEAQRQAEWRAEATRALSSQQEPSPPTPSKPPKKAIIGPQLPR